jgi:hypothetical protein
MKFAIEPEHVRKDGKVDFHVEAYEGKDEESRIASFYAQAVDPSGGWLAVLQQIVEKAPNCCQDFAVTHQRWAKEGLPYSRRMSEWVSHCPHHIGIGFPAYHVATLCRTHPASEEAMFECTYCGCVFPESKGIEVDRR